MDDIKVIIEDPVQISIEQDSFDLVVSDNPMTIEVEAPVSAPDITAEHSQPEVCVIVGDINLTIYGMTMMDWWNDNFAKLDLDITLISGQYYALAELILKLEAHVYDPLTGNDALASVLFKLQAEVTNHYGNVHAHAELFIQLHTEIINVGKGITANADNMLLLESDIVLNAHGIDLLVSTTNTLKASYQSLQSNVDALAILVSRDYVRIQEIDNDIYMIGESTTSIRLRLADIDENNITLAQADEKLRAEITRIDGVLTASASHTIELAASIGNGFNPSIAWEFTTDAENWVTNLNGSLALVPDGVMIVGNGSMQVDFASETLKPNEINGGTFPIVVIRWFLKKGAQWEGQLYYKFKGGGNSWTAAKSFPQIANQVDYGQSVLDMSGTAWTTRTITALAIKFSGSPDAVVWVDSVGIGRKGSLGNYAHLITVQGIQVTEKDVQGWITSTITLSLDGINTSLQTHAKQIIAINGDIKTRWYVKADHNGAISGLFFNVDTEGGTEETISEFKILVDSFKMVTSVGAVQVFSANGDKIDLHPDIFIHSDIESDNFATGTEGWRILQNGGAFFNAITIYDGDGGVLLSSGTGLNLDNSALATSLDTLMLKSITDNVDTGFVTGMLDKFKENIEKGTLTAVKALLVEDAWIKNAYIGNLAVGTMKIANNAVSSNEYAYAVSSKDVKAYTPGYFDFDPYDYIFLEHTIDVPPTFNIDGYATIYPCAVLITASFVFTYFGHWETDPDGGGDNTAVPDWYEYGSITLGLTRGAVGLIVSVESGQVDKKAVTFSFIDHFYARDIEGNLSPLQVGNVTYKLTAAAPDGGIIYDCSLTMTVLKK